MRYQFMRDNRSLLPVKKMCQVLGVSNVKNFRLNQMTGIFEAPFGCAEIVRFLDLYYSYALHFQCFARQVRARLAKISDAGCQ